MKLFSRLFWLLLVLLLAGEILAFRGEILYHRRDPRPEILAAGDPAAQVNHYVAWPETPPLGPTAAITLPGMTLEVTQPQSRPELRLYRWRRETTGQPAAATGHGGDDATPRAGRLVPHRDAPLAPLADQVLAASKPGGGKRYALLLGVEPERPLFFLYLGAILLAAALLAAGIATAFREK